MKPTTITPALALLLSCATAAVTVPAASRAADNGWQLKRLLHPTPQQIRSERQGRVFIYDGLRLSDVETAMDDQFDRVQYMMFVRTVVPASGGEEEVEEDGCDD